MGAGVAAAVGALSALAVSTVKASNEISRFAALSNTSTTEFQKLAAGGDAIGISQEKLSDIFKDVNDKVGDFLNTGGGELKDFFTNIAPLVGVTAAQFRNLSGPEALGLYVSSLEKAGASQADMTFYLESVANDATLLLPLLRNNAEGFKAFGSAAEAAGAILDEKTIKSAREMSAATWLVEQSASGLKNQISAALLPTLANFATQLNTTSVNAVLGRKVSDDLADSFKGLAKFAIGSVAGIHLLGQGLKTLSDLDDSSMGEASYWERWVPPARIYRAFENFDSIKKTLGDAGVKMDETSQGYAALIASFDKPADPKAINQVQELADLLEKLRDQGSKPGTLTALTKEQTDAAKAAADVAVAITRQVEALEDQASTVGMSTDAIALYTLTQDGASAADLARAKAALEIIDSFEKQKKVTDEYTDLVSSLRTEEEQLTDQMRARLAVLDAMQGLAPGEMKETAARVAASATSEAPEFAGIAPEVAGAFGELNKIAESEEKLADWYASQLEMIDRFRADRADLNATWDAEELSLKEQHEKALSEIESARQLVQLTAGEQYFGDMSGLAKAFFGEQSGLYKAALATEKAFAIAKILLNAPSSFSKAFDAVVGIPVVGPVLAPAAGAAAVAAQMAQVAVVNNVGMAHDGIDSVPEDGSWFLQKGERVTTAETSAKLDRTLERVSATGGTSGKVEINVNEDASRAGQMQQRTGPSGEQIIDLFVANIKQGGEAAQVLENVYGSRRVGR
ncbi:hypothetical protein D3C73_721360 [compost metagenome]